MSLSVSCLLQSSSLDIGLVRSTFGPSRVFKSVLVSVGKHKDSHTKSMAEGVRCLQYGVKVFLLVPVSVPVSVVISVFVTVLVM